MNSLKNITCRYYMERNHYDKARPASMQTGSRVTGEIFFDITQKGKFRANDFKRGVPPKYFFLTMHDKTSLMAIFFVGKTHESLYHWFSVNALRE